MSQSRKHTPIGDRIRDDPSDKVSKTRAHRRTRVAARNALARGDEDLPSHRQTENPNSYRKDRVWLGWTGGALRWNPWFRK